MKWRCADSRALRSLINQYRWGTSGPGMHQDLHKHEIHEVCVPARSLTSGLSGRRNTNSSESACKSISFWIAHSKVYSRHLQSVRPFPSGRPHGWSQEKHAALRLQSGMGRGVCAGTRLERWVSAQPGGSNRLKAPACARDRTCSETSL